MTGSYERKKITSEKRKTRQGDDGGKGDCEVLVEDRDETRKVPGADPQKE